MIKKLRFRFALSVIMSAMLILLVLMGTINMVMYRKVISDSDRELDMLTQFSDRLPPMRPDANFTTYRYDEQGNLIDIFTSWNSVYAGQTQDEYAEQIISGNKDRGFIDDFRFLRTQKGNETVVVIYDCGPMLRSCRSFLTASIVLSLICLTVVSIIAVIVSGIAVKPVAESYEKQRRFITDAGHEIKTPLAIINADADVLLAELGDDNEWVSDIKTQTKRLSILTNDLIRLSKMEEGKEALKFDKEDLARIVRDQAGSFKTIAAAEDKMIELTADDEVVITGDADALTKLVSILIDNAVKYSPEGGKITVSCRNEDRTAVVEVGNNTGEPLDEEVLDKLFDRFYRVDASRSSDRGGYGIGLATAKATAEAHGGSISVRKTGADGIVFTVVLPKSR